MKDLSEFYISERDIIDPPTNVVYFFKNITSVTRSKIDDNSKKKSSGGGKKKEMKKNDFLNLLNTLSELNLDKLHSQFSNFQQTWSDENTNVYISFIINQNLHSEIYAKLIKGFPLNIIFSLIEGLLATECEFRENCTIGKFLSNLAKHSEETVSVEIRKIMKEYFVKNNKNEEMVLEFLIELTRNGGEKSRTDEFMLSMNLLIAAYFATNLEINMKKKMLYLDYCDEMKFLKK
jgi:hypothetical protein